MIKIVKTLEKATEEMPDKIDFDKVEDLCLSAFGVTKPSDEKKEK